MISKKAIEFNKGKVLKDNLYSKTYYDKQTEEKLQILCKPFHKHKHDGEKILFQECDIITYDKDGKVNRILTVKAKDVEKTMNLKFNETWRYNIKDTTCYIM